MAKHKHKNSNKKNNHSLKYASVPVSFEQKTTKTHSNSDVWTRENINSGFGHIILTSKGIYKFASDNGRLYDVPQNAQIRAIYESGEKCAVSPDALAELELVQVIKTFGKAGDPIPEGLAIAEKYELNIPFSDQALTQAEIISKEPINTSIMKDFTQLPFITIDPKTSKDFDDAFYIQKAEDGSFDLFVAIANVANIVKPGTKLFEEVMERGISHYLGEATYSMTPDLLATDVCSLKEGEQRPSLVTKISYSPEGKVQNYEICLGIIQSDKRLNYAQAEDIHEKRDGAHIQFINQHELIENGYELSDLLKAHRDNRGAMNIGSRQADFIMSEDKTRVLDIVKDHLESSTDVIESFMIACNEVWGDFCKRANIPFIYRNHDPIKPEKEEDLKDKLGQLGIYLPTNPSNFDLKDIIEKVKGSNFEEPVLASILKASGHAYYSVKNNGHAGLGISEFNEDAFTYFTNKAKISGEALIEQSREEFAKNNPGIAGVAVESSGSDATSYGHTTSPIRRGADLLNQIQMISVLTTGKPFYSKGQLAQYCVHLNEREIISNKAEDEYTELLTALWAKEHLGEVYEGVVVNHKPENILVKNLEKNIILDLPKTECAEPFKINKKTGEIFGYSLGTEVVGKIFDATLFPPRVYISENLEKPVNYPTDPISNSNPSTNTNENSDVSDFLETDN